MNVIEIFINDPVNAKLDLDTQFDIALQYSIADIRDISKRNAAYSKTVNLPGTKNNNFWFGNLFDINSDFTSFNPNKKTSVKVVVNGEIVLSGFLQLRNIEKLNNVDQSGNTIRYEVVLFNNAVDLMTELGEKTLYDLDLSEFRHVFNKDNVEASWQHTWEDGYVYPITGEQTQGFEYNLNWFYPNTFYKLVFDRILSEAGYGWTGSFKSNPQFEKEIISFVKDGNKYIDEEEALRREFRAGITSNETVFYNRVVVSFSPNWPLFATLTTNPNTVSPNSAIIRYRDDFTSPNFDGAAPSGDNWSVTAWEWTSTATGTFNLEWGADYTISLYNDKSLTMNTSLGGNFLVKTLHYVQKSIDGGTTWTNVSSHQGPTLNFGTSIPVGASVSRQVITAQNNIPEAEYVIGTKVRVVVCPIQNTTSAFFTNDPPGSVAQGPLIYVTWNNSSNNYIFNDAKPTEIGQGSVVDLGFFLPDKLKQKDLISDLIKRYNLYIEVSPDNDKLLIIRERPNFYNNNAQVLDWTQKKDFSIKDEIALLSELQFKELIWTYKLDKDIANDIYERETGDTYGQQEFIFDNDFVKGVKKIESPFASTPIVETDWGAYLSSIDPQNPKVMPRVLYWGGLKSYNGASWQLQYIDLITTPGATLFQTYNQYPYAGHFDDPVTPRLDINFGENKFYFYEGWDSIPTNNMYNTYWSDYVRQIETGKLLTTYLYLDETDIRFIKDNFNTKIFLVDSYYYVNKIYDYKPQSNTTTKVELIKIDNGIRWVNEGSAEGSIGSTNSCPLDLVVKRVKNGWYYVSASGATVSQICCESIGGIWDGKSCKLPRQIRPISIDSVNISQELLTNGNSGWGVINGSNNSVGGSKWTPTDLFTASNPSYFIEKSTNIVSGNRNNVQGFDILSMGDDNDIVSSLVFNMGSNNTIEASNVFVFGVDNATFSESDKAYFGDNFVIDMTDGSIGLDHLSLEYINFNTSATYSETMNWGDLTWNVDEQTLDLGLSGSSVLHIGQETLFHVVNQTGGTIRKGEAVSFAGTLGSSGKLLIQRAIADGTQPSQWFMGIADQDILNGEEGYIIHFGKIRGINTNSFNEGDLLWVSATNSGTLTNVEPQAPNKKILVAAVVNKSVNQGVLMIRPSFSGVLNDKDDVQIIGTPSNNDVLTWVATASRWENKPISTGLSGNDGAVSGRWVLEAVDTSNPTGTGNFVINSSTYSDVSVLKIRTEALSGGDYDNYFNYLIIKQNDGYIVRIQITDITDSSNFSIFSSDDGAFTAFGYQFNIDNTQTIFNGTGSVGLTYSISWSLEPPSGLLNLTNILSNGNTASAPILLQNGSTASPSLSFDSDSDTGVYSSGTNQLGMVAGSTLVGSFRTTGLYLEKNIFMKSPNGSIWQLSVNNSGNLVITSVS